MFLDKPDECCVLFRRQGEILREAEEEGDAGDSVAKDAVEEAS